MHLLDSDTLTHWYAGHPRVLQRFQETPKDEVATTIISKIELLQGRFDFLLKASTNEELLRAQEWLSRTEELLAQTPVVLLGAAAVAEFQRLRHAKGPRKLRRADMLIASIVLAAKATLVTRNIRHFKVVPGLKLVNWVD
jgi:tRNA(fMet)-specific endonuclease VapC